MDNTKIGIKWGNSYQKIEKSPGERQKYTYGNLADTFRQSQRSFSIRIE